MKIIELDFSGCKYLYDLHEKIKVAFDFPEWYGKNWSAFWDLLWSECDAEKVIINGENQLPDELKVFLPKIHEILERNVKFHKDMNLPDFTYEIID